MNLHEILVRHEVEEDLNRFGKADRNRILRIVRQRLGMAPEQYGKPLSGPLKGLRRIRIGDYRIAYQVDKQRVIIWAIKHRKDIYQDLEQRLKRA